MEISKTEYEIWRKKDYSSLVNFQLSGSADTNLLIRNFTYTQNNREILAKPSSNYSKIIYKVLVVWKSMKWTIICKVRSKRIHMARNLNSNFNILSASGMEALSQVSSLDINRMLWIVHSGLFPRTQSHFRKILS